MGTQWALVGLLVVVVALVAYLVARSGGREGMVSVYGRSFETLPHDAVESSALRGASLVSTGAPPIHRSRVFGSSFY